MSPSLQDTSHPRPPQNPSPWPPPGPRPPLTPLSPGQVDRSVTGLVAQQQCVGPLHTPLADVAVVALSHFDTVGAATALGEQPIKGLLDPAAGARLALTEALTNLVFARITDLRVSTAPRAPRQCHGTAVGWLRERRRGFGVSVGWPRRGGTCRRHGMATGAMTR